MRFRYRAASFGFAGTAARGAAVAGIVGVLTFWMTRSLPGDAAYRIAAGRYGYDMVNAAAADAVRRELGLDQPLWQQLGRWMRDLLSLRLGNSMVSGEAVIDEIGHHLANTLALSVTTWVIAALIGLIVGTAIALRPHGWPARLVESLATLFRASPLVLIGIVLSLVFAVHLHWLPVAGHGELQYVVLPACTLALPLSAGLAQVVSGQLRLAMASDYVEFAQTKGLPLRAVVWRHAVRNMAVPVVAYAGVQLVILVEGLVAVETLFAWPGVGHALVDAIFARDVPVIQGTALVLGVSFVLLNAAIDALTRWIDPRMAVGRSS